MTSDTPVLERVKPDLSNRAAIILLAASWREDNLSTLAYLVTDTYEGPLGTAKEVEEGLLVFMDDGATNGQGFRFGWGTIGTLDQRISETSDPSYWMSDKGYLAWGYSEGKHPQSSVSFGFYAWAARALNNSRNGDDIADAYNVIGWNFIEKQPEARLSDFKDRFAPLEESQLWVPDQGQPRIDDLSELEYAETQ